MNQIWSLPLKRLLNLKTCLPSLPSNVGRWLKTNIYQKGNYSLEEMYLFKLTPFSAACIASFLWSSGGILN